MKSIALRILKIKASLLLMLAVLFLNACDNNRVFEENIALPNNEWDNTNILKFDVDVTDTLTPTNFYINIRNADGYSYSNIHLFIKTIFPNGKESNDTLECTLADEKGQWLGSGMGDIYDNQIPFKRNVRFPLSGVYSFEIQQGMRDKKLPLIMDAGLRIESVE